MRARIFLNGYYAPEDDPFHVQAAGAPDVFRICVDGALEWWDRHPELPPPDRVVGDFDSLDEAVRFRWERRGVPLDSVVSFQEAKEEFTDAQLALYAAAQEGCRVAEFYGAFPLPRGGDHDHFLGNLYVLAEARQLQPPVEAFLCAPREQLHCCAESIQLVRRGGSLNRVSLLPLYGPAQVARSRGLRWPLNGIELDPFRPNALRNEFLPEAEVVQIDLAAASAPVLVVHNW